MTKIDLTKEYKSLYSAKKEPHLIDVPPANFLMIDGRGAPSSEIYVEKVGALYPLAYKVKFLCKEKEQDFVVCKLEGMWWFDSYDGPTPPREEWNWTMMIRMPDFVTADMVEEAREQVKDKQVPYLDEVRFAELHEGLSAQVLYIGPYSDEAQTIIELHEFVHQQGYELRGHHHEIYFNDPRRTDPAKLKTILRHPVE